MSGEIPTPEDPALGEPVNLSEFREKQERINLGQMFGVAKNDFISAFSSFSERGWLQQFGREAQLDLGYRSKGDHIMPTLKTGSVLGSPFVNLQANGMLSFSSVAELDGLSKGKGIEAYVGVATARAFIAYAREHTTKFNDDMFQGVSARASLHNSISNSRYAETLFGDLSLQYMIDPTVMRMQMHRAMFGLMHYSNPPKYLEMLNAFDENFRSETANRVIEHSTMKALLETGQIDNNYFNLWLADSFSTLWYPSIEYFDSDEIEHMLNYSEDIIS